MFAYEKMYFELFHAITSTTTLLRLALNEQMGMTGQTKERALEEKMGLAIVKLRAAQQKTEQMYMDD